MDKKPNSVWISPSTEFDAFELDEVFWFTEKKSRTENRANVFIMTMMSRNPRQIVGFAVDRSVNPMRIQEMIDSVEAAEQYCTDGCQVYRNVIFGGRHIQNFRDKQDTHLIKSTNADLRSYIAKKPLFLSKYRNIRSSVVSICGCIQ